MEKKLELLAASVDPATGRELLFLYEECQWRTTRLQILHMLHRFPQPRVLEFLMRVAWNEADIPMCEAAIWSLGKSKAGMASRFLVHFFETCSDVVKPFVIVALGHLGERALVPELLKLLPTFAQGQQTLLFKNTLLTLAELKVSEVVPFLENFASTATDIQVAMSALLALGKVSRKAEWFENRERLYENDLFRYQIFTTAKTQVQMRAQWKLEDYLNKIFSHETIQPELAQELNTFEPEDVFEGLGMFADAPFYQRLCFSLAACSARNVPAWYGTFFSGRTPTDEQKIQLLESIACHCNVQFRELIFELKPVATSASDLNMLLWSRWIETLAFSLPDALVEFEVLIQNEEIAALPDEAVVSFINALVNNALVVQSKPKKGKVALKLLDKLLSSAKTPEIQNRVLRGFGQLEASSPKSIEFVRGKILLAASASASVLAQPATGNQLASCLFYLEKTKAVEALEICMPLLTSLNAQSEFARALFKTLAACKLDLPENHVVFDKAELLLVKAVSAETQGAALGFLARYPSLRLQKSIASALANPREEIQMPAILAAKALGTEDFADVLSSFLDSPSTAIAGRSLDALLFLQGNRPKLLLFDFLEKNIDDKVVCEKIIRDLKPPRAANAYFAERLDKVLAARPQHPLRDGFVQMRQMLASGGSKKKTGGLGSALEIAELAEIDAGLQARIDGYLQLDEDVKSALRAAEAPFFQPEVFNSLVDKSTSILEYAKALDMVLNSDLGRALLFPRLENNLAQFQNLVHAVGLNEEYPQAERVLKNLGLEKYYSPESLPVYKMATLCRSVLNGKIMYEQWKVFDGLRAWAVVLLLFCRAPATDLVTPGKSKPLLILKNSNEASLVDFAKRLNNLQEVRNPAAHRQTLIDFPAIDAVRQEVFELLRIWRTFSNSTR